MSADRKAEVVVQFGMIVGESTGPITRSRHLEPRWPTARSHQRRSSRRETWCFAYK